MRDLCDDVLCYNPNNYSIYLLTNFELVIYSQILDKKICIEIKLYLTFYR